MVVTYGTKKYYERELDKAQLIAMAVKSRVCETLNEVSPNDLDANELHLLAEVLEKVESDVGYAQTKYDEYLAKEKEGDAG